MKLLWHNDDFEVVEEERAIAKGSLNRGIIKKIPSNFIEKAEKILKAIGYNLEENKKNIKKTVKHDDLANFLFIRALLDYGGVAPSYIFERTMLDLYEKHPFLFKPKAPEWKYITNTVMEIFLLPIAGLHRTRFENIAKWWVNIIEFLLKECEGDASNFFIRMAEKYDIDVNEPESLEEVHLKFEKEKRKEVFPYGDKNGRLMIALLSNSRRGFGVLKGVKPEHLKLFNVPVDSQVIRVCLNTGLVKFTYIASKEYSVKVKGKEIKGQGIEIDKLPLVEICQKALKAVADKLNVYPIDLDIYIWFIGALFCKRFGMFCWLCPLRTACKSVERGYVGESRGVDWFRGCFSLGKPQLKTIPILRTCKDCPDYVNNTCSRGENYKVIKEIKRDVLVALKNILCYSF